MSTLALQVEEALRQFDAQKRLELELVVMATIERLSSSPAPAFRTEEEKTARFHAAAGSLPDFPEDYIDSPWETDRDPL
jgi:hypothetical protein